MILEWFNPQRSNYHYLRMREKNWCHTLAYIIYSGSVANAYLYHPRENKVIGTSVPNVASLEEAKLWVEARVRLEGWICNG